MTQRGREKTHGALELKQLESCRGGIVLEAGDDALERDESSERRTGSKSRPWPSWN